MTSSSQPPDFPKPAHPTEYRSVGVIQGRYLPSEEKPEVGLIQTLDGETFVTEMKQRLWQTFQEQLNLEQSYYWKVYPRTKDLKLRFTIKGVRKESGPIPIKPDYFSIRGQVVRYNEKTGNIRVTIRSNRRWSKLKPYGLRLEGFLPDASIGWFYSFEVERSGHQLLMIDAEKIAEIPKEPEKPKEEKKLEGEVVQGQEANKPEDRTQEQPEGESTQEQPEEKPQ